MPSTSNVSSTGIPHTIDTLHDTPETSRAAAARVQGSAPRNSEHIPIPGGNRTSSAASMHARRTNPPPPTHQPAAPRLSDEHAAGLIALAYIGASQAAGDKTHAISRQVTSTIDRSHEEANAGVVATVNLGALRRNYQVGKRMLGPDTTPAAVIKADGYGLGSVILAKALMKEHCSNFFVARIGEAVALRKQLRAEGHPDADRVTIHVLDGNLAGFDPNEMLKHDITPVLNSLQQVRQWDAVAARTGRKLPAILQFDTGMSRAGMSQEETEELLGQDAGQSALSHLHITHVMTHLAKAGDATLAPGSSHSSVRTAGDDTRMQLQRFDAISRQFPDAKRSIGASSTVFLGVEFHKDMVRMGGTFHGQAPFDAATNPLEPILTLTSKIAQVRTLSADDRIGYGLAYTAADGMKVATIPMGYADGLPRVVVRGDQDTSQPRPYVLVDGQYKAPLLGATSMDMASIDVSGLPEAALAAGTSVTLIGPGKKDPDGNPLVADITPDDLGNMYNTNASEAQTKLSKRIFFKYIDE